MLKNILKVCLVSCVVAIAIGSRDPEITASALDVYPDNLNIDPYVKIGNKLYHFGQSKESWYKASLICRSMGGFLASFDTKEELTHLSSYMIAKYPTDRFWWLSGSDLDSEGDFYWYRTGERISYADWSAGQPDNKGGKENCVHLWFRNSKYQMNDWQCNQKAYFVCEAEKPKTFVVSVF